MSSNYFFEQQGRLMYGNQFGYAIEYELTRDDSNVPYITLEKNLLMPDDPQNWVQPMYINLVSEFLAILAKSETVIVRVYGKWLVIRKGEAMQDIKQKIRILQYSFIKVESDLPDGIKSYLISKFMEIVKDMPVY